MSWALERHRVKRLVRDAGSSRLVGVGAVQQRPGPHTVVCAHEPTAGQVGQAGDVVEVEVGEQDVEARDSVEQLGSLDQAADAGAGVDHDRRVAVAQERAGGVPAVGRKPAAAAEDNQAFEHRADTTPQRLHGRRVGAADPAVDEERRSR